MFISQNAKEVLVRFVSNERGFVKMANWVIIREILAMVSWLRARGITLNRVKGRTIAILLAAVLACVAIFLSSCDTTNHDALNPTKDIVVHWWRVETPPSVVTEFFACFGTTGLWLDQADGNISTTQNDPMCPRNGTPYQLVERSGTNPAVDVGGLRFVPPDSTGEWSGVNGRN